jgi:hypothetical protein
LGGEAVSGPSETPACDYSWIRAIGRRLGHTTAAANAARESGGVLVVNFQASVRTIGGGHDCHAVALQNPQALEGGVVPVLFDLEAVKQIVADFEDAVRAAHRAGRIEMRGEIVDLIDTRRRSLDLRATVAQTGNDRHDWVTRRSAIAALGCDVRALPDPSEAGQ